MNTCLGVWGRLFGHKFVKTTIYSEYESGYCFRCGMPRGGWRS